LVFERRGGQVALHTILAGSGKANFRIAQEQTLQGGFSIGSSIFDPKVKRTFSCPTKRRYQCCRYRIPQEGEYFTGNARYEGYSLDLIDEISKLLGFEYEFELTPDQAFGAYNKETKQWNGLVKQLLDRVS
jgi:Ligated ion channel L-glutamate- and glycine-binding site